MELHYMRTRIFTLNGTQLRYRVRNVSGNKTIQLTPAAYKILREQLRLLGVKLVRVGSLRR